ATALALAELLLDATEAALPLLQAGPARPALEALELLATGLDLYSWDGPPGWDEVLARGLAPAAAVEPRASALDGLGEVPDRAAQLQRLDLRARAEAAHLVELGKSGAQLVAIHASLSRPVALAAAAAPRQ